MEIAYSPYKGKDITEEIIEEIREKIKSNYDGILKQAFESIESLKELDTDLQGKNLLLKNIIKTLVCKILDNDKKDLPFKIVDLERKINEELEINVNGSSHKAKLSGRIDRIDERTGVTTIIDYKTGRVDIQKIGKKTYGEYLDMIFNDPKYKENFQAYFYAYSYLRQNPQKEARIAIYALRKLNEGLNYLTDDAMTPAVMDEYGKRLKELIGRVLSPEDKFIQTEDKERCRFCAFKSICYRE